MTTFTTHGLSKLFDALGERGYTVVGPTVRDEAIVYEELSSPDELPVGWRDEQNGGQYRLHRREDYARFGYVAGPQSWKRFLYPPSVRLWSAKRTSDGFDVDESVSVKPLALIGVRPCDLEAIKILDRVLLGGEHVDAAYCAQRKQTCIIAVNCTEPGGTCFCASMGTGPGVKDGYDIVLTEMLDSRSHCFVAETGSELGRELLEAVEQEPADDRRTRAARAAVEQAASRMGRKLETRGLRKLLQENSSHPRWDEVADRCLTCGNCTQVCPTCFCHTVEDTTSLTGDRAERWRRWDSCFSMDFSYIHGGSIRNTTRSRYRQWITHKLSAWVDQFGTEGCVGCGRCITWCPVGIDITEEVREIRGREGARV